MKMLILLHLVENGCNECINLTETAIWLGGRDVCLGENHLNPK